MSEAFGDGIKFLQNLELGVVLFKVVLVKCYFSIVFRKIAHNSLPWE